MHNDKKDNVIKKYYITGMTCSACSNGLEKYLTKQDGIENASVNLVMAHALIEYDENKLNMKNIENFKIK